MKRILLAAAAVLAVTAAQAETIIYVTPGSAVQWVAPQSFKTVINGNENCSKSTAEQPIVIWLS